MAEQAFFEKLAQGKTLLNDGAWGTELQRRGLPLNLLPEVWNVDRPDTVRAVADAYYAAGADMGQTNTFNANLYRLRAGGLGTRLHELNLAAATIARAAADAAGPGRLVLGTVGPSGERIAPKGLLDEDEMYEGFRRQIEALKEGGVDGIVIETMFDPAESAAAIRAAKRLGLFTLASMTFHREDAGYRTAAGLSPREAARALDKAGADVVGANCIDRIDELALIIREMRDATTKPLLAQSNAGEPKLLRGHTLYEEPPARMAGHVRELVEAGARIIGGCCGTTPEHIKHFRTAIDALK